jgi:hypothetical protein
LTSQYFLAKSNLSEFLPFFKIYLLCRSQRRFDEHQAENWWTENREKVHERYNVKSSERVSSAASAGKKNLSDSVKGGTESAVQSHPTLILGQCVDDNQVLLVDLLATGVPFISAI